MERRNEVYGRAVDGVGAPKSVRGEKKGVEPYIMKAHSYLVSKHV